MRKRLLAIIATAAMVVTMVPSMAFAVETLPSPDSSGVITLIGDVIVDEGVINADVYNASYSSSVGESNNPSDGGSFYAPYQNHITSYNFIMGSKSKNADITMNRTYTGSAAALLYGTLAVSNGAGFYGSKADMKAWMNVNVNGGYTFAVGYSNKADYSSVSFDGKNHIAKIDLKPGAEIARFGHIFVGSDNHDKGENAFVLNILSGATVKDFGQLTTRGDGTINVDGNISAYTTKSYQSSSAAASSMHENAKDGGHSNNNGIINVSKTGSIKIDSMNVGRKPSLNTGNAKLNIDGGTVEFSNYINVGYDSSARIGEINLKNGAQLISNESSYILQFNNGREAGIKTVDKPAGTLTIGVAADGKVKMDAASTIRVGKVNLGEKGSIVVDANGFTGKAKKVIEQTETGAASLEGKVKVENLPSTHYVSYDDGDVTIIPYNVPENGGSTTPSNPDAPEKSPNTGDHSVLPFAVAGIALVAMAAVVATRRREN